MVPIHIEFDLLLIDASFGHEEVRREGGVLNCQGKLQPSEHTEGTRHMGASESFAIR